MERPTTRRAFLLSATAALGSCVLIRREEEERVPPPPRMDIHVHLFGNGDSGSGCYMSEKVTRGMTFALLVRMLKIRGGGKGLDRGFARVLVEQVDGSGLDMVAVLAQDCVYGKDGMPDMARSNFFVPNDYLFEFVAEHADQMTPCVSINPDRRDCIEELERCVERGARLLKIHPPTQGVDIADKKHTRFFRRCADLGILVMVHTGHEHAAPVIDISLADPLRLQLALDQGCRVVACHSGSGWNNDSPDYFSSFVAMARRNANLYGDTSVMATLTRARDLDRAMNTVDLQSRFVHGSDFPFPSWPIAFVSTIGPNRALELQQEPNLIRRDYELKEVLGIGKDTAERSYRLVFGASRRGSPLAN